MGWFDDLKGRATGIVGGAKEFLDEAGEEVVRLVNQGLESTSASASDVRNAADGATLSDWRLKHGALAAACAGGNLLPGPLALAALTAEIPALLHLMSRAALGVGFIVHGHADDADYKLILAHWSGALKLDDDLRRAVEIQLAGATGAAFASSSGVAAATAVAGATGGKLAVKIGAKANVAVLSGAILAVASRQGAVHIGTKLAAATLAQKIIASLPARIVPILGVGVAATINAVFMNGIITAAADYYGFIEGIEPVPA